MAIGIKTTNLIRPENSLKFRVLYNTYMDHIFLQLEDIEKRGKKETKDTKVTNFPILSAKPKRKVRSKRKMPYQEIDEFIIVALQNYNFEKLNPNEINIRDSKIQGKLLRYGTQRYKYRFVADSLLISSSVVQDTNAVFLSCNGLNSARDSLINGKLYKSIGVININK